MSHHSVALPSLRHPFGILWSLVVGMAAKIIIFIYSRIRFSISLPKSDPVQATDFDAILAMYLVFVYICLRISRNNMI